MPAIDFYRRNIGESPYSREGLKTTPHGNIPLKGLLGLVRKHFQSSI
jgi:hypothetical protein